MYQTSRDLVKSPFSPHWVCNYVALYPTIVSSLDGAAGVDTPVTLDHAVVEAQSNHSRNHKTKVLAIQAQVHQIVDGSTHYPLLFWGDHLAVAHMNTSH